MSILYKAMDIAQYVINYSIDKDCPVSNLKLQKLLYYIQAAFLVENSAPCFEDNIENWRHGPVIDIVYKEYKANLNKNIEDRQSGYSELTIDDNCSIVLEEIELNERNIDIEDKKLINKVINSLSKFDPWFLVKKTHEEDPWLFDSKIDEVITNESINKYFNRNDNKKRIYGLY